MNEILYELGFYKSFEFYFSKTARVTESKSGVDSRYHFQCAPVLFATKMLLLLNFCLLIEKNIADFHFQHSFGVILR